MKVMVTATQTTKMPWMRRMRANRAVARCLAARHRTGLVGVAGGGGRGG